MTHPLWRILIIEDNADLAEDARREIADAFDVEADIDVEVRTETDFEAGLAVVRDGSCDLVVLDVRRDGPTPSPEDETAGHTIYQQIRAARFAPVIFWTALPESVADEAMQPLVAVVKKDDMDQLPGAIKSAIASGAVEIIADIAADVAAVLTRHMWTELAPHWEEYTAGAESTNIARVLISRLARILDEDRDHALTAHPSHRYVYPPATAIRGPGDVVRAIDDEWWVVLTPSCDLAQNKYEFVLLANARSLEAHPKHVRWAETESKGAWNDLKKDVLTATSGRYHYLPAFRDIPDLVIDLERVQSVTAERLAAMDPIASLVSPFAEALLVQNSHFRGRIGVPDMDADLVKERLSMRAMPAPTEQRH
ncbi:CheY-like chemotaxis protein [Agrococcus sp. UYP10]|uniref:hypothetical protein n=1 Tax=Agrococcus sp. UYP10 TaxID=1756355 RepID=UPI00339146F9